MAMAMQIAETTDMVDTWFKVRGNETMIPMMADIAWKRTVHCEESDNVLRILAPVKTWKPTVYVSLFDQTLG
jgi:hypothetical protein